MNAITVERPAEAAATVRRCRVCGCTQDHACTDPEHGACWWVEADLCSHCGEPMILMGEYDRLQKRLEAPAVDQRAYAADMLLWADKARAALQRAAFTAWDAFEV